MRGKTSSMKLATVAVSASAFILVGCGSDGSTETLDATVSGQSAVYILDTLGAQLGFTSMNFAGPVVTAVRNPSPEEVRGSGNDIALITPAGNFAITMTTGSSKMGPVTMHYQKLSGGYGICTYKEVLQQGTYTVDGAKSTGKFAGASGSGTYTISGVSAADTIAGSTCSPIPSTRGGNSIPSLTSVTFRSSGPLTLKN
jgi:hypothetical protein